MRNYFSKLGTQVPWRTSQSRGATLALPLRYLSALFLLLTFSIGQSWAADLTAHAPGVYEKTVAEGGYGCTLTTVATGENAGVFEVYYFSANSKYGNTTDVYGGGSKQQYRIMCADNNSEYQLINTNGTGAFTKSCDWIEMAYTKTGFSKSDYTYSSAFNEFFATAPNGGNTSNTKTCYIKPKNGDILTLKVSGYVEFAILGADNGSSKYMTITVDGGTPTSWKSNTLSRRSVELTTGEHTIVVANVGTSANNFYGFSLKLPAATKHTVTYALNGGTGTTPTQADVAEGAKFTLHNGTTGITAPTNKDFDGWHDGTTKYAGGAEYTMGTSNVTLTAQWQDPAPKYAVTYVLNGPSGDAPTQASVAAGTSITLASAPTWAGHAFDGWLCSADAAVKAAGSSYTMTAAATTFTAQWHEVDCKIYSLTGEIGSAAAEADASNVEISAASLVLKSSNAIIKLTPGEGTFKAGDVLTISGTVGNTSKDFGVKISASNGKGSDLGTASVAGTTNPLIATATLSADADYLYICRTGGTTQTLKTVEVHRSCAEGTAAGLSYAEASVNKYTTDAAFTNPLTNTNGLVLAGYKSSNEEVATVNFSTGEVTIVGGGNATISVGSAVQTKAGTLYAAGTASYTLTVAAPPTFAVTYDNNGGEGTMTDSNSPYAEGAEVTLLANSFTAPSGYAWSAWAVTETVSGNPVAVSEGKFTMPGVDVTVTAQWATISDFDVKFFQGYGDPDVQIGTTQTVSTGNFAVAPEDPERAGFAFLGWSYDATEAHIVDVATYAISAATNFTAMWKAVWTVTFDGAGNVIVEDGEAVASPNSPVMAGKVFQGWYNAEVKYDFSAAVTGNLALTSKWADADPNHYVYAYNDDFHFDGVVYKTPEGKVDAGNGNETINLDASVTLFSGTEGITSVVAANAQYDSKGNDARGAAIQYVTAMLKLKNEATSKVTVTIKSGYTATLKIKSSGFSATRTVNVSGATPESGITTGSAVGGSAPYANTNGELTFALTSGAHDITVTGGTLYISELDIEATALPAHTVTYMPGEGTGAEFIIDDDATEVSDGSTMFTAPEGKIFHGWKDALDNDVAVGAIVEADMTLTAQWIAHYAVTFDMQGHGTQIVAQDIVHGSKAVKPADPVVMGWDFGGWFTDAECTAGNEFDFETPITAATPLFAKWTEFEGCALLYPALSGSALNVGDNIDLQSGSKGGSIQVVGMKTAESSIAYDARGLLMGGGSADIISVTLANDMDIDTKITVTLDAKGGGRPRGLYLLTGTGANVKSGTLLGWPDDGSEDVPEGEIGTFSYTVEASDGLEGTNVFRLKRQNSTYIKCIKVESCGAAVTFHNLTSAVNIAGKGTVTLGASSVREGYTTTATYSEIDPLYEFVSWSVSGAGASVENATANPATITVGTEDAVVTLNLQLIPVKFTVNYFDGTTPMGSELVPVNQNPTASEIETAKRGYVFEGWGMSSTATASDVVALNTITSVVEATINLYAVYTEIPCPTEGNLFTWTINSEADEIEYPVVKNVEIDMMSEAGVMNISGGTVSVGTTSSSSTFSINDGAFAFRANSSNYMRIELDCALQVGDVVSYVSDNSANRYMSIYKDDMSGTAVTTATDGTRKYIVANNESPIYGAYVLYIKGSNSDSNFKTFRIDRPYTITFDLQGHGDAITAQKLIAGDKVVEPAEPTDAGWDFKGWYKEAACTNSWDFDNDVVAATMALYAKWTVHVTNDATLKSLKYGSEAIALEDGVFEYNIGLPAMTVDVPALTAVANSMPVHSLDIVNASAFDGDGNATSKVTVVSEDETVTQVYTVNFSKLAALPQVDVTKSIIFDFSKEGSTSLTNQSDVVLANLPGINNDENFNSQALFGSFNQLKGTYFQGSKLSFTTTVPGIMKIGFRGTNEHLRHLQVCVGEGEAVIADWEYQGSNGDSHQTKQIEVPAGKVTLKAFEGTTPNNARIYRIEFLEIIDSRTGYAARELGTACYEYDALIIGAKAYEVAGVDAHGYMAFDEIPSGEIEAGKPYLFEAEGGKIYFCKQVGASETPATEEIIVKGMHGTFTGTTLDQGVNNYYYFSGRNIWKVNDFSVSIPIPEHRCYVDYDELLANPSTPNPAPGRRRVVLGLNGKDAEQVATDIDNLNAGEAPMKVMINGQLFILRGEKMYDATGRLVK